jgi:site-specific recombinase XerD
LINPVHSHKHKIFKIFTGVKVEDKYWNLCSPKKNCPNLESVLTQIAAMETRILNASMKVRGMGIDPTVEKVNAEFYAQVVPALESKPFWQTYKTYLELKCCRDSTRRKITMTYKVFEYYCSWSGYKFSVETWNQEEFGRLVQYMLLHQKMADSTIARHIKSLKSFLRYAYPQKDLSWMRYVLLNVEEEVIALLEPELKNLIDADLGGWMEATRDLFVFLATTGMRFSDSQLFNPNWVTPEQVLEFSQLKTGGKAFPPPYEVARRVLLKYNGVPPQISNQKFNHHLKELFEELKLMRPVTTKVIRNKKVYEMVSPLSAVISSHTARRTFITLCLEKGMPIQDVMKMSGHSDYKSMKPYIKITRKHIRMVADKWEI